jgi:ribonuclease D
MIELSYDKEKFYINSQSKLDEVIRLIKSAKIFAMDTEFTREITYYPILSIIQIAVKDKSQNKKLFIVDCLCDIDFSDLFDVISDPKIIKILHSSAQDLQIFYHKSGQLPQGIIDSQVMANFCNLGFSLGYSNLVETIFGKQLDKKQQRSNWQARPLSQKQIDYALLDVFFLEEIYENFQKILEQKSCQNWFLEEMQNFINKSLLKSDDDLGKNFSFAGKNQEQIAKIKSLILWREIWARKIDVPRRHFLKDETLEKIVLEKEIPAKLNSEMKSELSEILNKKSFAATKEVFENQDRVMTAAQKKTFSDAKNLITKIAQENSFSDQFLITSSDLKKVICDKDNLNKIVCGWRYQVFGEDLKQLISKI